MAEYIGVDEILKCNPQLNADTLEEHRQLLRKLRASGTESRGYSLVPPYAGRRASIEEGSAEDKRTVRLRSLSRG